MNSLFYFLLLALTTVLAVTARPGEPVRDVDGDIIFHGSYYVLPRIFAAGGGLTFVRGGDNKCPLYIGQDSSEVNNGIPVRFSDWRTKVAFVPESTNLHIEMDVKATICAQPTYWRVAEPDSFIAAGPKPSYDFFQIQKIEDFIGGYKIVFCFNGEDCVDVGISVDGNGVRRLAIGSRPFEVVFVKATESETKASAKPMSII